MRWAVLPLLVACAGVPEAWETPDSGPRPPRDAGIVQVEVDAGTPDAGEADAGEPDAGQADAGSPDAGCAVFGAPGQCVTLSACAALGDHTSYAGYCPGPSDIECCIDTPNPADNPPTPAGYKLLQQSQVTTEMTQWAVDILHDPVTYPMFSTTLRTFGALTVLARVEWHPPDFQNGVVHRGVTLYQPI